MTHIAKTVLEERDGRLKSEIAIRLDNGNTLTIEDLEKALYEARGIIAGVGGIGSSDKVRRVDKWIATYFPSWE